MSRHPASWGTSWKNWKMIFEPWRLAALDIG